MKLLLVSPILALLISLGAVLLVWLLWSRISAARWAIHALKARNPRGETEKAVAGILTELARECRQQAPRLLILPEFSPNAAVLKQSQESYVLLTEGLIHVLDDREMRIFLSLCLARLRSRRIGRILWLCRAISPLFLLLEKGPKVLWLVFSPLMVAALKLVLGSKDIFRTDKAAVPAAEAKRLAALMRRLGVLGRKIPLKRWSLSFDALFLFSPLGLSSGSIAFLNPQPGLELRVERLQRLSH